MATCARAGGRRTPKERSVRVRPEFLQPARSDRRARAAAALPRKRRRLYRVQPARRWMADGKIPARIALPGRFADDAATRAVRAPAISHHLRRAHAVTAPGRRTRRRDELAGN